MAPIHLDFYTGTLVAPDVVEAMPPYLEGKFGNPSSPGWEAGAKRSLPRGKMPRKLIQTTYCVEFRWFGMIAANNHQAG